MAKGKDGQITLPLKEFYPVLQFAKNFVADKDIVPAYKSLYLVGDSVRAYTGTAGAVCLTPWAFPVEGFGLQAQELLKVVGSLHEQGLETLVLDPEKGGDGRVLATAGRFKSRLPILKAEDELSFITRDIPKTTFDFPETFWWDVERIFFSMTKDETKPGLRNLHWTPSGILMSCDDYRMTMLRPAKTPLYEDKKDKKKVTGYAENAVKCPRELGLDLPGYLLERLGAKRKDVKGLAFEGENVIWFALDAGAIYGPLGAVPFPAARIASIIGGARQAIKESKGGKWTQVALDDDARAGLGLVIDRILLFSEGISSPVQVVVDKDTMTLSAASDGAGEVEEVLPVSVTGPGGTFIINGQHFKEVLLLDATPRFWFLEGLNPIYFLSSDKRMEHLVAQLTR